MQTIEATIVILTPIDHDPISIVSIYIPPRSDEYTFTIDIENLIQTSSNCVLFGDFNAPHTAWNCNTNSSRGVRLLDYVNMTNLYIAYPDSPTSNENWSARLKALDTQDNSLWAIQKFLKNKRSDIPPLNCSSGTAVTDTQKANILAESIFDNFTENSRPNNDFDNDDELINNTVNTFLSLPTSTTTETAYPSEIISYIKKSNSKKAPGKDGISNRMTKNFSLKAILILTILINKILTLNYFPKAWKEAIIFPILKPGKNKNIPSSYRPISLLSTLSKITESIILTRLKEFLYTNNIINPNQYGFTNKLSTLHPLLNLTEAISEGFQSKKSTGAVFLDIQKAFDRVWLTGLTYKLINYKIPPPLVFLLHSYNSNRSYQVRVKDTLSTTKFINCGVAQGTLRHELRNPHDPGNYSNDWLDQSAASYMLAGYSPQSFLLYYSDMGWRLASRAICPDIVTVVTVVSSDNNRVRVGRLRDLRSGLLLYRAPGLQNVFRFTWGPGLQRALRRPCNHHSSFWDKCLQDCVPHVAVHRKLYEGMTKSACHFDTENTIIGISSL
ncbi:probable RNA-directed DNA polymerase from transposon X-element [Trichonephila clavipes]|nr:probable RNA-directed DNA polymerase from transposon X-element [Trichonephila clavipes]